MSDLKYPVIDQVKGPDGDLVPLLDVPMMSDEKWDKMVKEQQEKHPEEYAEMFKQMREHPELYPGMITPLDSFDQLK